MTRSITLITCLTVLALSLIAYSGQARIASAQEQSSNQESAELQAAQVQAAQAQTNKSQADKSQADKSQADKSQADKSQADKSQEQPSRQRTVKSQADKAQPDKAQPDKQQTVKPETAKPPAQTPAARQQGPASKQQPAKQPDQSSKQLPGKVEDQSSKPQTAKKSTKKKPAAKPTPTPMTAGPVTMPPHAIDGKPYLPGMVNVSVKGQDNPVVGVGMALSGVTVIEFPRDDSFFAVHPPENGDFVRIEKSPSMKSDHHLVLRAGVDLFKESGPAASMTIQMTSGLTVVLWIFPTKKIDQQTHRCVFRYNRNDIVFSRKQSGLAVNLDKGNDDPQSGDTKAVTAFLDSLPATAPASDSQTASTASAAPVTIPVSSQAAVIPASAPPMTIPVTTLTPRPSPMPSLTSQEQMVNASVRYNKMADAMMQASTDKEAPPPSMSEPEKRQDLDKPDPALVVAVKNALNSATKDLRLFRKWSSPTHGLSVSTRGYDLNESTRIVLIAVKNVDDSMLRIMPGHPELVIETRNDKDKVVQLNQVNKLAEETSAKNQVIPARGKVYYAIAYTAPILSTRQVLRVTIGQKNAADAPATDDLSARRKK